MNTEESALSVNEVRKLLPFQRIPYASRICVLRSEICEGVTSFAATLRTYEALETPRITIINGKTGTGKTTFVNLLSQKVEQLATIQDGVLGQKPVIFPKLTLPVTISRMATAILESLGDPWANQGSIIAKTQRIVTFQRELQTKLLVFDDFFISLNQSGFLIEGMCDWLEFLLKDVCVNAILIGLKDEVNCVVRNHKKLSRMSSAPIEIATIDWEPNDSSDVNYGFLSFLASVEDALPLNGKSNLADLDMAWRLCNASRGNVGVLMKIIRTATILALESKIEYLDDQVLAKAYSKIEFNPSENDNPFVGPPPAFPSRR